MIRGEILIDLPQTRVQTLEIVSVNQMPYRVDPSFRSAGGGATVGFVRWVVDPFAGTDVRVCVCVSVCVLLEARP